MVKVVDVENNDIIEPENNDEIEIEDVQEVKEIKEVIQEISDEVKEVKPKSKKEPPTGTCEHCGKTMLMKTLKYSHKKLCQPPPPPTPIIEEKPKAKAKPRAKPKPREEDIQPPQPPKKVFDGTVDFNKHPPAKTHSEIVQEAKQYRLLLRSQRVKSLIAQAI
jgi:hypothetical protein